MEIRTSDSYVRFWYVLVSLAGRARTTASSAFSFDSSSVASYRLPQCIQLSVASAKSTFKGLKSLGTS